MADGATRFVGAEFVVRAGDLATYADAGHLASAAGLVPVPPALLTPDRQPAPAQTM
jgi:hypothetical protein